MLKTDNSPAPATQIRKDKMRLTVTNIYPAFQKKSKQETRQEIGERFYQISKNYAEAWFLPRKNSTYSSPSAGLC